MSSQRGNVKKGAQKYQNRVAYKPKSADSPFDCPLMSRSKYGESPEVEKIMKAPTSGLCERCKAQIEWRKQFNKYKPLTQPGKWSV